MASSSLARKSVKQRFASPPSIEPLMESFRLMCNDAIRIGLAADASSLKRLSKLTYGELMRYGGVPSYYKLCAISKAAGILAARKKSTRRGFPQRTPISRSRVEGRRRVFLRHPPETPRDETEPTSLQHSGLSGFEAKLPVRFTATGPLWAKYLRDERGLNPTL